MKNAIKVDEFLVQRMDNGDWLVTSDGGLALAFSLGDLLRGMFKEAFSDEIEENL